MKRFLRQLALFAIGILCANAALWVWSQRVLLADYRESYSRVLQAPYQAILLGDSHAEALGKMGSEERMLSFGFASDSLADMYVKLNFCLEKQVPLKVVILEADDHMLNGYRLLTNNRKRSVEISSLFAYRAAYGGSAGQYFWEKYVENYLPIVAGDRAALFRRSVHSAVRGWLLPSSKKEAGIASGSVDDWGQLSAAERKRRAEERVQAHFSTEQSPELEEILRKIMRLAREHGIRVVGLKYPLTPEYRESAKARFKGRPVDDILRAHGVEVFDFSQSYDAIPAFFKDPDHLNARGAQVFVEQLSSMINKYLEVEGK